MQPWQAYLNMFQHTKLKDKIDDAWNEHLIEVPEDQKNPKKLFGIRNKVAQKMYATETSDVKKEVKLRRREMMSDKETEDFIEKNKSFQA